MLSRKRVYCFFARVHTVCKYSILQFSQCLGSRKLSEPLWKIGKCHKISTFVDELPIFCLLKWKWAYYNQQRRQNLIYKCLYFIYVTVHCSVYCTLFSLLNTVQFTVHCSVYCTLFSLLYSTLFSLLYTVQFSVHCSVYCTLFSLLYTVLFTVHFLVYSTMRPNFLFNNEAEPLIQQWGGINPIPIQRFGPCSPRCN